MTIFTREHRSLRSLKSDPREGKAPPVSSIARAVLGNPGRAQVPWSGRSVVRSPAVCRRACRAALGRPCAKAQCRLGIKSTRAVFLGLRSFEVREAVSPVRAVPPRRPVPRRPPPSIASERGWSSWPVAPVVPVSPVCPVLARRLVACSCAPAASSLSVRSARSRGRPPWSRAVPSALGAGGLSLVCRSGRFPLLRRWPLGGSVRSGARSPAGGSRSGSPSSGGSWAPRASSAGVPLFARGCLRAFICSSTVPSGIRPRSRPFFFQRTVCI